MNIELKFDPDRLEARIRKETGITNPALANVFTDDQMRAEVQETAGRVAVFYQTLIDAGMSEDMAGERAATYCDLLLAKYFQLPVMNVFSTPGWED